MCWKSCKYVLEVCLLFNPLIINVIRHLQLLFLSASCRYSVGCVFRICLEWQKPKAYLGSVTLFINSSISFGRSILPPGFFLGLSGIGRLGFWLSPSLSSVGMSGMGMPGSVMSNPTSHPMHSARAVTMVAIFILYLFMLIIYIVSHLLFCYCL